MTFLNFLQTLFWKKKICFEDKMILNIKEKFLAKFVFLEKKLKSWEKARHVKIQQCFFSSFLARMYCSSAIACLDWTRTPFFFLVWTKIPFFFLVSYWYCCQKQKQKRINNLLFLLFVFDFEQKNIFFFDKSPVRLPGTSWKKIPGRLCFF